MKKILALLAAVVVSSAMMAQITSYPYFTSFEGRNTNGWTLTCSENAEATDPAALEIQGLTRSGDCAVISLNGNYESDGETDGAFVQASNLCNMIASPFFAIPQNVAAEGSAFYISVNVAAFSEQPAEDNYQKIITALTNGTMTVILDTMDIYDTYGWTPITYEFSELAGGELAFLIFHTGGEGTALLVDDFSLNAYPADAQCNGNVRTFPYNCGFETDDEIACWDTPLNGNESFGIAAGYGFESGVCAASYSFNPADFSPLQPNNFLISPAFEIPAGATNVTLSWYAAGMIYGYADENYDVYVSTSNEPASFTNSLFNETLHAEEGYFYEQRQLDLTQYKGQTIYVAFRHHGTSDKSALLIDDVKLNVTGGNVAINNVENANVLVSSKNLNIFVNGLEGQLVTISDINGRTIVNEVANGNQTYTMAQDGIYFVQINGAAARKVAVIR